MTCVHVIAQADCPVFAEGLDRHAVLQAAALATKWWEPARDALDTMILNAANLSELAPYSHTDFTPFDATVKVLRALGSGH
jgi:H+-transporting ATPase